MFPQLKLSLITKHNLNKALFIKTKQNKKKPLSFFQFFNFLASLPASDSPVTTGLTVTPIFCLASCCYQLVQICGGFSYGHCFAHFPLPISCVIGSRTNAFVTLGTESSIPGCMILFVSINNLSDFVLLRNKGTLVDQHVIILPSVSVKPNTIGHMCLCFFECVGTYVDAVSW